MRRTSLLLVLLPLLLLAAPTAAAAPQRDSTPKLVLPDIPARIWKFQRADREWLAPQLKKSSQVIAFFANRNVPPLSHVGWAGTGSTTTPAACDIKTATPVVQFTPPTGGEYVVSSTSSSNFWRSQLGLRLEF